MGLLRGIKGEHPEHEIHSDLGLPSENISSCHSRQIKGRDPCRSRSYLGQSRMNVLSYIT